MPSGVKSKGPGAVNLSESRGFLMGLGILWVAFFHYNMVFRSANPVVAIWNQFVTYGFFGVDIFLFLSGYGLCFSFQKNQDLGQYLSRRAKRILPTYLVWVVILCLELRLRHGIVTSLPQLVGNLTCTSLLFQLPNRTNWYLQAIWLFYLLFPFLYAYLVRRENRIRYVVFLCALSLMVLAAAQGSPAEHYYVICRIPSFVFGVYFGIRTIRKETLSFRWELASYALFIATFAVYTYLIRTQFAWMNETGMRWTVMIPMLPGLLAAGCRLRQLLNRFLPGKKMIQLTEWLGTCSMEYLMIHLLIRYDVNKLSPVDMKHLRLYQRLLLLLAAAVLSGLFHKAMSFLTSLSERRKNKN